MSFDNIFRWLYVSLLVIALPLSFHSNTQDPVLTIRILFLSGINMTACIYLFYQKEKFKLTPIILLYSIFVVLGTVSSTTAFNVNRAIYELVKHLNYLVALVCFTSLFQRDDFKQQLLKSTPVLTIILGGIAMYQHLHIDEEVDKFLSIQSQRNIEAFFANKNLFADALALLIPFLVMGILTINEKLFKVLNYISLLIVGILLLIIKSKLSFLAISIGLGTAFIGFVLFSKDENIAKRSTPFGILIGAIIILLIIGLGYFTFQIEKIEGLLDEAFIFHRNTGNSFLERLIMYRNSILMSLEHFFSGVGIGNWNIHMSKYGIGGADFLNEGKVKFQRPHNDFLLVLSETGIFGLITFLSIFYFAGKNTMQNIKNSINKTEFFSGLTLIAGIGIYFTISNFNFPKERVFIHVLFLIMLALTSTNKDKIRQFHFGLFIGFLALILISNTWLWNRFQNEQKFYTASLLYHQIKYDEMIHVIDDIDENYLTLDQTSTPIDWYKGQALFLLNRPNKALEAFKEGQKANPYNNNVLNDIASCYEILGDRKNAKLYYKSALNLYPRFSKALINLAVVYYHEKEYEKALEQLILIENPLIHTNRQFIAISSGVVGYYVHQKLFRSQSQEERTKWNSLQQSKEKKTQLLIKAIQTKQSLSEILALY